MGNEPPPDQNQQTPESPRAPRSRWQAFKEVLPLLALVATLLSVAIGFGQYKLNEQSRVEAEQKEQGLAEVYYEGSPPKGPCSTPLSAKPPMNCALVVTPTDKSIRVVRFLIQYPSAEFPDGSRHYDETYGPPTISLAGRRDYILRRLNSFLNLREERSLILGHFPIIIYSYYIFNGKKYWDSSAYYISYVVADLKGSRVLTPVGLTYCGRLKRVADFLVDPWLPSPVGYADRKSTSVMFNCLDHATWFDLDRGRYSIVPDIAAQALRAGGFDPRSIPLDVKSYESRPIGRPGPLRVSTTDLG